MTAGLLEAGLQRCQWRHAAQHQQIFGEGDLHHHPEARQYEQRCAEHDQQRTQRGQYRQRRPYRQRPRQHLAHAGLMATAAGVEEQDQRTDVQRIEEDSRQQLLRRQRALAQPVVDRQLGAALEHDQRQAEPGDGGQVAGIEIPGVAQDGQNVHVQGSLEKQARTLAQEGSGRHVRFCHPYWRLSSIRAVA